MKFCRLRGPSLKLLVRKTPHFIRIVSLYDNETIAAVKQNQAQPNVRKLPGTFGTSSFPILLKMAFAVQVLFVHARITVSKTSPL